MTTTWDENLHPRAAAGQFAEKAGSAPETSLHDAHQPSLPDLGELDARLDRVNARYRAALEESQLLSAKVVAAAIKQRHPNAAYLTLDVLDAEGMYGCDILDADRNVITTWDDDYELSDEYGHRVYDLAEGQVAVPKRAGMTELVLGEALAAELPADPEEQKARARAALSDLSAATADYAEETDGGDGSDTRAYEHFEDAKLRFAEEAESILSALTAE